MIPAKVRGVKPPPVSINQHWFLLVVFLLGVNLPAQADLEGAYPGYTETRSFEPVKADYQKELSRRLSSLKKAQNTPDSEREWAYSNLAEFYMANFHMHEASVNFDEALKALETDSHERRAHVLLRQAQMARYSLKLKEALVLASTSLKEIEKDSYEYRDTLANALMMLGDMQALTNKWTESQASYKRAETYAKLYAGETTSICDFWERKANLFYFHNQTGTAEALYKACLARRKGENMGEFADANDWYALIRLYQITQKPQLAAPYIESLWKVCSNHRDRAHPDKAEAALKMAELSATKGDDASTGGYLWKAYRLYALTYGLFDDDCIAVLKTARRLSKTTTKAHLWKEIDEYFPTEDALISQEVDGFLNKGNIPEALKQISRDKKGASPRSELATEIELLNAEAIVSLIRGNFEEAEVKLFSARAKSVSLWGKESGYVADQNLRLAQVYLLLNKLAQAQPIINEAQAVSIKEFGANSKEHADCLAVARQLSVLQHRGDDALKQIDLQIQINSKSQEDPRYIRNLETRGDVERAFGKLAPAALDYWHCLYAAAKADFSNQSFRVRDKIYELEREKASTVPPGRAR